MEALTKITYDHPRIAGESLILEFVKLHKFNNVGYICRLFYF